MWGEPGQERTCLVAKKAATCGKDTEGMATVEDIRRFGVEAVRDKEEEQALAGRVNSVRVQIDNLV